jgi:hypothetical protein
MYPYTADIHLHADGKRNGRSRHGEKPKVLATSILESGVDVYAISEHHYVTEETEKVHSKLAGVMTGRKRKREIVGFDGVELGASYKGLPFYIGYVFENRLDEPKPGDFPDHGIDISGAEFQDWRAQHPGIAVVNHPIVTHREKQEDMRIDYTTAMLADGTVDGCEVLNGAILLNGKNGSSVRRTVGAARAFIAARTHRRTAAIIASSDAHWGKYRMPEGVKGKGKIVTGPGCVRTRFIADSPADFLDAVRDGRTKAVVAEQNKIRQVVEEVLEQCPELANFLRLKTED